MTKIRPIFLLKEDQNQTKRMTFTFFYVFSSQMQNFHFYLIKMPNQADINSI